MTTCEIPACGRPARARGLCNGHLLRARRGRSLDGPVRVQGDAARSRAEDELLEAALALADCPTGPEANDEFRARWERLKAAGRALPRE